MTYGPENDPMNRLGRKLLRIRVKEKGWTLAYVDDEYGVDKGVLSRVERGDTTPSLATLYKLRQAYGPIPDDEFLTWVDLAHQRRGNGGEAA